MTKIVVHPTMEIIIPRKQYVHIVDMLSDGQVPAPISVLDVMTPLMH